MGEIIKQWVKEILTEDIKKEVVVYAGRFQPFHRGHYDSYQHLVKRFGKDNVYIGTSDKTDKIKSPFKFKEKKMIMMKMFGIPSNKIVQIKNPYAPKEIIGKFDKDTTAFITVVGEKDRYRLKGKYFQPYHPDKIEKGYEEQGYVYVTPQGRGGMSGTKARELLSKGTEDQKKAGFKQVYNGKFDPKIFKFITDRLTKIYGKMERFLSTFDMNDVIKEAGGYYADPGEPETGYLPGGYKRKLGTNSGKPEPWFDRGGYEQMHFPEADYIYSKDSVDSDKAAFAVVKRVEPNKALKEPIETDDYVTSGIGSKGDELRKIDESSSTKVSIGGNSQGVDDGPGFTYGNSKTYKKIGDDAAEALGWEVVDYILGTDEDSIYADDARGIEDKYPVSYFPSGVDGLDAQSQRYVDFKGNEAYKIWADHIRNVATAVGYKLIDFLDAEEGIDDTKEAPTKELSPKQKLKEGLITEDAQTETSNLNLKESFIVEDNVKFYDALAKNANKWYTFSTNTITKVSDNIIKLVQNAYKNTDDGSFVNHKSDLKYSNYWYAIELDDGDNEADAVIFARKSPNGIKIQGIGHDGDVVSKRELLGYLAKLLLKNGHWIEASGALEKVLYRLKVPYISSEKVAQSIFPNTNLKMIGDGGKYTRKLENGKEVTETIFGKPNVKVSESFINEGGAYGHMNHPFDIEMNLTFGDLKTIIRNALNGNLEFAREKTDGQALAISWRDDRGLIAARNKGHLKNSGENALDISGVASKFQGRGGLTDAYNFAMKDLSDAIKGLSKAQRDKVFKQGSSFMNLEVIYPTSVNVIPYGQPLLIFHGTMDYDENGKAIGADTSSARMLAGMIKQINKDVQSNYTIQGPPVTELPKSKNLSSLQSKFEGQLKKIQSEFKLKDSDGVADYHQAWWEQWVEKNSPSQLDNKAKMGLVKRWAFLDKGFRLDKKNITDSDVLDWAKKTDKQDHSKMAKDNLRKFEDIFLGVGAEVLSFMSSVITVNPDKAIRDMKKRLDTTIKDVQKSGDPKKIEKLRMELERLSVVGGKDKIVPNEGIVFVYKGNTYKLTGAFASLNQILGLMYF